MTNPLPSGAIEAVNGTDRERAVKGSGTHSARELYGTAPGTYDPRSFVRHYRQSAAPFGLVVVAPWVPVGYGTASAAPYQFADAYARRIDSAYRFRQEFTSNEFGEFRLGFVARLYL